MKLYIDTREPFEIKKYINYLNEKGLFEVEIKNLEIGDYVIYDEENDKIVVIIERKSLSDLESSIKDGRYNEQSYRLSGNELANHNIYYLIEGSIINYRNNKFKSTLYSSLVSLSYYKGFSILNSVNNIESAEIIFGFVNKILREKGKEQFYKNNSSSENLENSVGNDEYINVIKTSKKSNITNDNINEIMLMQIPGVSVQSAKTIMNKYKTIKSLVLGLEEDNDCLCSLKLDISNRKISKNVVENIKNYLLN